MQTRTSKKQQPPSSTATFTSTLQSSTSSASKTASPTARPTQPIAHSPALLDLAIAATATPTSTSSNEHLPIILPVFNHKGGVGKTTATYNLGYVLNEMGLRTLMVDGDPQANLTTQINPELSLEPDKVLKFREQLAKKKQQGRYSAIDDIFAPSIYGSVSERKNGQLPEPEIPTGIERAKFVDILPVHNYKHLFYLPGSIKFDKLTDPITLGIGNVPGTQAYANMVPRVLREIGRLNDIDIILVDLNPNINGLNQSIVMNSDYLLMPFKPELGCLDAAKNLAEVIPDWFDKFRRNKLISEQGGPHFLGAFPQWMRTRASTDKSSDKKESKKESVETAYEDWIMRIYKRCEDLLNAFRQKLPDQKKINFDKIRPRIGIRDMVGAGLHAQRSGHPMSDTAFDHKSVDKKGHVTRFRSEHNKKKQQIDTGYKKVIGTLFREMSEEHLAILQERVPNLLESLNLYATLNAELDRGENLSYKPAPQRKSKKRKRAQQADLYTDAMITELLEHYVGDIVNAYYTTPMQGDGRFSEEELSKQISDYLLERIADDDSQAITKVVIPLNVGALPDMPEKGGNHWVLAFVRYGQNVEEIFYFDPLGGDIRPTIANALITAINRVFETTITKVNAFEKMVQTDGFNCGPWIIEAARLLTVPAPDGSNLSQLETMDINARRRDHQRIIRQADQEANPSKKAKVSKSKSSVAEDKSEQKDSSGSLKFRLFVDNSGAASTTSSGRERRATDKRPNYRVG